MPAREHSRRESAYTLIDLLVILSGAVPGFWVSRHFHGAWRTASYFLSSFAFGIILWCLLFLWLLPAIRGHREGRQN
jgi:hypothetical protein